MPIRRPTVFLLMVIRCNKVAPFFSCIVQPPGKVMHIGKKIREVVKERNISIPALADALCCTREHVYKLFQKESLNTDLLKRISEVLHHDFFAEYSRCIHFGDNSQNGYKADDFLRK